MKLLSGILLITVSFLIINGCTGKKTSNNNSQNDTTAVADTGFTGIKQYYNDQQLLVKEVTFKNGIRQGLTKSFYQTGQLNQTFWYENNLREDSARWYFLEGGLFRTTPFKHDTIDGIQIQYYRTKKMRAKIGYSKGLRTPFLEEFDKNGKTQKYPEIVVIITDQYKTSGKYIVNLEMSDKSKKVTFYRGEFINGCFDTSRVEKIKTAMGKATISLKKSASPGKQYLGIISENVTPFGNRNLTYKKIDLPYNDLN